MNSFILSLATSVPKYRVDQVLFSETLANVLNLPLDQSEKLKKIFINTGIRNRHSVIEDYEHSSLTGGLYPSDFPHELPGTRKRNLLYKSEAPKLALDAARKSLDQWGGDYSSISHVISVSCTGMMAPGIEFHLIEALGLRRSTARLGINFMGCFGAFQGLDTARAFAAANPGSRVLVVCTELCSLHMQPSDDLSSIVSNALFADGAAGVVVGADPHRHEAPIWEILRKESLALKDTENEMSWELGNDGCLMELSDKVPKEVERAMQGFLKSLLGKDVREECCEWLVHPGGKAILLAVARACGLDSRKDLKPSWDVMREFGNMSSATFLFVVERALKEKKFGVGIGFGPGLSLEGIVLKNACA
jgi:predicted naringenin-chalcone synthase